MMAPRSQCGGLSAGFAASPLQQIGRIVGRLPRFIRATIRMTETQLGKVEGANEALDREDWIVWPNVVLDPGRKQAGLIPALAGLEGAIRHKQNRTSTPKNAEFLPSLAPRGSSGATCMPGSDRRG